MADESSEASTFDREADATLRDTDNREDNTNPSVETSGDVASSREKSTID